jgi:two-component system KDP operon response regulator KdpE
MDKRYSDPSAVLLALWSSLQHSTKVLLVEDDPLTRHLVRKTLRDECQFLTAATAERAIDVCRAYQPDIVLLDLGLPDQPGNVVFDWLRAHDPYVNVILFTQSTDDAMLDRLMKGGATGVIHKPFTQGVLLHHIHHSFPHGIPGGR